MKKTFKITVKDDEKGITIDRENKGFSPLELLGLIASEYQRLQMIIFKESNHKEG